MKRKCEWKIFPIASRYSRPKCCKAPVAFRCFLTLDESKLAYACDEHGHKWKHQNPNLKMEAL